jgi:hypothetical protein
MRTPRGLRLGIAAATLLVSSALLTGCIAGTAGTPSESPVPVETPAPSAEPTPEPGTRGDGAVAMGLTVVPTVAGDCAVDPAEHGVVTFVVTADDDTTPIELNYTAFQPGADPVIRTASAVGPVVTVMQTNCGNQAASEPWTFTATSATQGSLACTMYYGGKQVKADGYYAEGATGEGTVDCSGHPGM